jgi:mono/diheme cytochrome c family protein
VRRLVPLAALAALAVGCSSGVPGGKVVAPTPDTVIGKVPKGPSAPRGNAAAGKTEFISTGCGACHTFKPAGASSKVGPDLDKLAAYAQKANPGTLAEFTKTSIVDPGVYVEAGYPAGSMPPTYGQTLKPQQLADLVAFLTQGS